MTAVMKTIIEDIILYNNKSFLMPLFLIALLFFVGDGDGQEAARRTVVPCGCDCSNLFVSAVRMDWNAD